MSRTSSSAEQRAATRRALARKAAARKRELAQADEGTSAVPVPGSSPGRGVEAGPIAAPAAGASGGPGLTADKLSALVLAAPDPAPLAELVLERARPEVLADLARTGVDQRGPTAEVQSVPTGRDLVETIEVGGRRRSRFATVDGRRLLLGPRLRRVSADTAARPDRTGGDAGRSGPTVAPTTPLARHRARRRLERRGFVPVTPGRVKVRHRILPRTVIGITTMLLAFGVGVGFSGAAFYAYYDQRLARNEETVARFVEGFDQQFTDAVGAMDDLRLQAIDDIRGELAPLGDYVSDANGVATIPGLAGPSVWQLETRDENGRLMLGSAFAVAAHGEQGTALITSYSLIAASTISPGPSIELVKDDRRVLAQLWAWDEDNDLALVVTDVTIPPMTLANEGEQMTAVGGRLFAVSGVGGQGATAAPGALLDHSEAGLQHTVPVGTLFQGGPLVDAKGRVMGVATLAYRPFGIDPGMVLQAPDSASLCDRLLSCAEATADTLAVDVAGDTPAVRDQADDPLLPDQPAQVQPGDATPTAEG